LGITKKSLYYGYGVNTIFANKCGINLAVQGFGVDSKKIPDGYYSGRSGYIPNRLRDNLNIYFSRLVRAFCSKKYNFRLLFESGIDIIKRRDVHFNPYSPQQSIACKYDLSYTDRAYFWNGFCAESSSRC
jgi:hypothetical protein